MKQTEKISYTLSVTFHLLLLLIFWFVNFTPEYSDEEYITIGFGSSGNASSPGTLSEKPAEKEIPPLQKENEEVKKEEKKVEVPKTVNTDKENISLPTEGKKEKEKVTAEKTKPLTNEETGTKGFETEGPGDGYAGFDIDYEGQGKRKIYSYTLPEYPAGVSKEIDVKLRFSILPDGTVGKIFPLIKADAKLELAAINSLRKWRFEPLPGSSQQGEQTVTIVFPYRLQ